MGKKKTRRPVKLESLVLFLVVGIVLVSALFYFSGTDPETIVSRLEGIGSTHALNLKTSPSPTASASPKASPSPSQNSFTPQSNNDFTRLLPKEGVLTIIVMDVGQGDSIFIQSPNGKRMLVDTGENTEYGALSGYLQQIGVTRFDVLVATHPHSDHIGSMAQIMRQYPVGLIYMPRASHTSNTYRTLLETIDECDIAVKEATGGQGQTIALDDALSIEILAPLRTDYDDLNNSSIVLLLRYGDFTMLLTGDIEKESETDLVSKYGSGLHVNVLKVPHHGSNTSSSKDFLSAVAPKTAIISTKKDNEYKHPTEKILERYASYDINVFRTDLDGAIALFSDGDGYEIVTEQEG